MRGSSPGNSEGGSALRRPEHVDPDTGAGVRRSCPRQHLFAGLLCLSSTAAVAQDFDPSVAALLAAVVQVTADVPANARTAPSLGTEREGSGVVIDSRGLIVTIGYLILEASRAEVTLHDGRRVPAQVVAYDHRTGFGLLRALEPLEVVPIRLGDSASLKTWDEVLVSSYGGPAATRPAITVSRRDFAGYWEYLLEDAIFTSPPHPLFGGAALLGPDGKLLGIGSLFVGDAMRGEEVLPGNMFVPVDRLKLIMGDLLTHGRSSAPPRPWLGVHTGEVEGRLVVRRLAEDGPAASAGMQVDDLIVGVGEEPVASMADFYRKVWSRGRPGDTIPITVLRGSELKQISIVSGDRYHWLRLNPSY